MKKKIILLTSFITAAMLVLGGFIIKLKTEEAVMGESVRAAFTESLSSMQDGIYEITESVKTAKFSVTSGGYILALMNARDNASYVFKALSALPIKNETVQTVKTQIAKINDFALSLIKKKANGEKISNEETELLNKILSSAETVKEKFNLLINEIDEKNINLSSVLGFEKMQFEDGAAELGDYLNGWKEALSEFPELNYDGKYGVDYKTELTFLKDKPYKTDEELLAKATKLLGESPVETKGEEINRYSLNDKTLAIHKSGALISLYGMQGTGEKTITAEDANRVLLKFLEDEGYTHMRITKRRETEKTVYFELCFEENGVYRYNDKITATVCLVSGRVCTFNAVDFLSNHNLNTPVFEKSEEQALKLFENKFEITGVKKAVIASSGKNEIPCYEIKAKTLKVNDAEEIRFFINASTLCEEKIVFEE